KISVSISTNNGRTFMPLWTTSKAGANEGTIDLKDKILRRYGYWLKIEIAAGSATGASLDSLAVENDIQHAPRTLPWLGQGSNTITVAADPDTTLATRTISCRISSDAAFAQNETTTSLGVVFENMEVKDSGCWWKGGTGTMTVPIETPGDLMA